MIGHKRIKWLDFMKGISILFVVIGHCANSEINNSMIRYIGYLSFIFVMPLFFSISGFLYKEVISFRDYCLLIYKKSISILLPYLFFSFLSAIYNLILHHKISILDIFLGLRSNDSLWFLIALFVMFMIVGFFNLLRVNIYIQLSIFIIIPTLFSDFWMLTNNSYSPNVNIYRIISYFMFFYLGILLRRHYNILYIISSNFRKKINLSLLFIVFLSLQIFITNSYYQTNFITLTDVFTKIFSVFVLFCICINIRTNTSLFNYFDKYGKYTLVIYLVHFPVWKYIRTIIYIQHFRFIIIFLVTWFISVIMCKLVKHITFINFVFYPRRYINNVLRKTKLGSKFLNIL